MNNNLLIYLLLIFLLLAELEFKMASPSMVHRTGDTLVVRSVVSGDQLFKDGSETPVTEPTLPPDGLPEEELEDELDLPQCKIKRNYICQHCNFFTQNPRSYLYHLKDVHKEKIKVYIYIFFIRYK